MPDRKPDKIRELNDAFRKSLQPDENNRAIVTQGIQDQGEKFMYPVFDRVRAFDDFSPDNDPHGEHDFGAFEYLGQKIFWKYDYYDNNLEFGSEDPSDPKQTVRVLTIMLASEY